MGAATAWPSAGLIIRKRPSAATSYDGGCADTVWPSSKSSYAGGNVRPARVTTETAIILRPSR